MSNIALQIERTTAGSVAAGGNVVFNSIVFTAGNITYSSIAGVITFNEPGRYVLDWWVATETAPTTSGVVFALNSSQGDFLEGISPIKLGEVVGIGIVNVTVAPVTVSLVNASGATVYYSTNVPVTATLVAVEDDIVGPTGETGPTGPTGPTGSTGPTGAGVTTFGYVYQLATAANDTVAGGADFPFSNNGPLSGITHTAGTTIVTVPTTGVYQIDYGINFTAGAGRIIALAVNTIVNASTNIAAQSAGGELSGTAILSLVAGDELTLRNNSASSITTDTTPNIGAQLNIILLS